MKKRQYIDSRYLPTHLPIIETIAITAYARTSSAPKFTWPIMIVLIITYWIGWAMFHLSAEPVHPKDLERR